VRFEFESGTFGWFYYLYIIRVENRICLSRGVQVVAVTWQTMMRIMAGVGDPVQRTGDGRTGWLLGSQTIERSGDIVCDLYRAQGDEECGFLG
jgi:hypothetical protein